VATTISKTTAAANIPQIWANKGLMALTNNVVLPGIVNRTWEKEFKQKGDRVNILNPLTVSVNAKAVQTEITLQAPSYSNVTITLDKHYEASAGVEDVAKTLMIDDKMQMFADSAMKALADQIDDDLVAEAANFTGTAVGTQGTAADPSSIRLAGKRLKDAKAPNGLAMIVGTQTESDFLSQSLFIQANTVGSTSAIQDAKLTSLLGFTVYMDQNISRSGGGDKNIAFHPDALALASAALYDPSTDFGGAVKSAVAYDPQGKLGIRFTMSWSQKDLAVLSTYDVLYGVKCVRPTLGLYVYGA
jgi:hypothetical protein